MIFCLLLERITVLNPPVGALPLTGVFSWFVCYTSSTAMQPERIIILIDGKMTCCLWCKLHNIIVAWCIPNNQHTPYNPRSADLIYKKSGDILNNKSGEYLMLSGLC